MNTQGKSDGKSRTTGEEKAGQVVKPALFWSHKVASARSALLKSTDARSIGSDVKTTTCGFPLRFRFPEFWLK
jgi:hypothetical protein